MAPRLCPYSTYGPGSGSANSPARSASSASRPVTRGSPRLPSLPGSSIGWARTSGPSDSVQL